MHTPVLKKEVLEYLDPKPNENFIDSTFGGGGHAEAILKKNKPSGKVLGIERDSEIFKKLKPKKRLVVVNNSYINLKDITEKLNFGPVRGILFDLGMSSYHIDQSGRGFTYLKNEPLDMRYSAKNNLTAKKILNSYSEKEIEKILKEYGQERFYRKIAKKILKKRPIKTTFQLVEIIKESRVFSFSRIFQALRIAVNDELLSLKKALPQAVEILSPGGRIVVISFHSLEDKIVKNFFKNTDNLEILNKKPITPSKEEIKINYRSRSAKLRAAMKK